MFQNTAYIIILMGIVACNPIIYGLHFLEREPKYFLCKKELDGPWRECSRTEICADYDGDR